MKDFIHKLKEFGYSVSDWTYLGQWNPRYVFEKDSEEFTYFINVNLQSKEITFYKVLKFTATSYAELKEQFNSGDFRKALAYPVDVQLVKLVADNFNVMTEFWLKNEEGLKNVEKH